MLVQPLTVQTWREMKYKEWMAQAHGSVINGMHILAEANQKIAKGFLDGIYDSPVSDYQKTHS